MEICKLPASRGLTFFKNGRDNRISDIICNLSATWGLNCCSKKNQTKKDIIRYLKILKCSAEELEKRQNLSCWNAQVKKRWTDKHGKAPTNDDAERIYLKVKFYITRCTSSSSSSSSTSTFLLRCQSSPSSRSSSSSPLSSSSSRLSSSSNASVTDGDPRLASHQLEANPWYSWGPIEIDIEIEIEIVCPMYQHRLLLLLMMSMALELHELCWVLFTTQPTSWTATKDMSTKMG